MLAVLARTSLVIVGEKADGRSYWMMRRAEASAIHDAWGNSIAGRPKFERSGQKSDFHVFA
ncbi:MAG: hypothetical protein WCK86_13380 [Planctomycetia bacterium]